MDRKLIAVCSLTVSALAAPLAAAQDSETGLDAVDFLIDWRARIETVDEAGFTEPAEALTSRVRAGLKTQPWHRTSLLAEAVWIEAPVDDYNSTTNGNTQYPVIPDPADFVAINRFAIVNESLQKAKLSFGRQRIVLDDQRFVGNVGWRQHEQTFDAVRAELSHAVLESDLTYASQVNRVFGPDSPLGKWEGDVLLVHLAHAFEWGRLTGFDYLLDLDDALAMSTRTTGLRLTGSQPLGVLTGSYTLSYARQTDAGDNPSDYAESYYVLEGGLKLPRFSVGLGYELLGGDGVDSFKTPLATLHAFQGWADKYVATPPAGIEDAYVKVGYARGPTGPFKSLSALAVYHDFHADSGSARYGDELDLSLVAATERMTYTLKYASYRADELLTDTDKLWLSVDYAF